MPLSWTRSLMLIGFVALSFLPSSIARGVQDDSPVRLNAVLVSSSGRWALINGRALGEGARVGAVEIIGIEDSSVVLRTDGREYVLPVGSSFRPGSSGAPFTGSFASADTPVPPSAKLASRPAGATGSRSAGGTLASPDHAVVQGETLFEIATRYFGRDRQGYVESTQSNAAGEPAPDASRVHRAMVALYEANPGAFGASMNVLFEGAVLRLPDEASLGRIDPQHAGAEVAHHVAAWHRTRAAPRVPATAEPGRVYGPVAVGETLSEIASAMRPSGVSRSGMMMALYDLNPTAFGGNINLLLAGARLEIPDPGRVRAEDAAIASERVLTHLRAWNARPGAIASRRVADVSRGTPLVHRDR